MSLYQTALGELAAVFSRLDDGAVDAVIARLAVARRIVVFGGGGERLQIMGFALRMFPMGLNVAVKGDMTTPFVGTGDEFLVTCGPGWIATAEALMQVARSAGAECILITATHRALRRIGRSGAGWRAAGGRARLGARLLSGGAAGRHHPERVEPAGVSPHAFKMVIGLIILIAISTSNLDLAGLMAAKPGGR